MSPKSSGTIRSRRATGSSIRMLTVRDSREWRAWMRRHHDEETEIWLVFFRKQSGRVGIDYEASVEEALCFGWIDSIVRRLDDQRYVRKFTPRTDRKKWSETNRRRVAKLIGEQRMTQAGLAKVGYPHPEREPAPASEPQKTTQVAIPEFIAVALRANKEARQNFNRLAPSYRRDCVGWIASAKRKATRERRLSEVIDLLERNEELGLR